MALFYYAVGAIESTLWKLELPFLRVNWTCQSNCMHATDKPAMAQRQLHLRAWAVTTGYQEGRNITD